MRHRSTTSNILGIAAVTAVATLPHPFYNGKGKLKASLDADEYEKLPEQLRDFYTGSKEDGYTLNTDDKSLRSKLDEFRATNVTLKREQEELRAALEKFKDIDPTKAKAAQEALDFLEKNEEAQLIKAGKFDEVIAKRTEKMSQSFAQKEEQYKKQIGDYEKKYGETSSKYKSLRLDTEFSNLFRGLASVKKGAESDILRRARDSWDINDKDEVVFRDENALDPNGKPWTQETWAKNLVNEASYFFEQSAGGGAAGSGKGQVTSSGGKKLLINPTPMEMGVHAEAIANGTMEVVRR
jgi:hypothetical protein